MTKKRGNKRVFTFISILALLIIATMITGIFAKPNSNLFDFKKTSGHKIEQEGILVDLPTFKDKKEVVDSIDPKTGAPTVNLKPKANDNQVYYKSLQIEDSETTIQVPFITSNGKEIAIYDPNLALELIPINSEYLITFNNSIYITDLKNKKLTSFINDSSDKYSKKANDTYSFDYVGKPVWASNPIISPTEDYLLFYSQRDMIDGNQNGRMWIKNIKTSTEIPTQLEGVGNLVGWLDNKTVILQGIYTYKVDVETGNNNVVFDIQGVPVGLVNNSLIYQIQPGSIIIESLENNEKQEITSNLINGVSGYVISGTWVAFQQGDSKSIALFDTQNSVWKLITAQDNLSIQGFSWLNGTNILVNVVSQDGSLEESTYTVDIDKLEVIK